MIALGRDRIEHVRIVYHDAGQLMIVKMALLDGTRINDRVIPEALIHRLVTLVEDSEKYFEDDGKDIEVDELFASRVRLNGVKSANTRMRLAYSGAFGRRQPIFVRTIGEIKVVVDGNSTFINALISGWKKIRALDYTSSS